MTITRFERNASIAEIAVEIDRRGAVIEKLEARLAHIDGIYRGAIDNLNHNQRQLDMDGVEVGVSRQALCEVLIGVEAALSAALPLTASPAQPKEWRCYHCDEVFTDDRAAQEHFGFEQCSDPACRIKLGAERSLVTALRRAEKDAAEAWDSIHNETTESAKAYYAQAARHHEQLRVVEEEGYERGLADGQALTASPARGEPLASQIDRLAEFIMAEVPGEPSQGEGAIDTAIRWMRSKLSPARTEGVELPEDLRSPLHSLKADLDYLVARLRVEDDEVCGMLKDSIRSRLSQIEEASYRLFLAPASPALEWDREAPTEWKPETWKAQSLVGEYDIQREKDGRFSGFAPNAGTDLFGTLEEAKAAAQADFDKRIRSALASAEPVPAMEGEE